MEGTGGNREKKRVRRQSPERVLQRDPERTRAAILEAATKEFAENGMGGARVDAIAERAGTNKRMLYHYFGDKEQLYLRVLEEAYVGIRTAERSSISAIKRPRKELASWRCLPGVIFSSTLSSSACSEPKTFIVRAGCASRFDSRNCIPI